MNMDVAVVYLGGQYNHLIARRVRELGANPMLLDQSALSRASYDCIIAGGGPHRLPGDLEALSMLADHVARISAPFLGICLSHQLLALVYGGRVAASLTPEYGGVDVEIIEPDELFEGLPGRIRVWESHNDEVVDMPRGFQLLASSRTCRIQAMKHGSKPLYGVQFHPEVRHTQHGLRILSNFLKTCRR